MRYFFGFCLFLFLFACAKITSSPEGGPEDTQAPRIVNEKSEANYQTNFDKRKIEIEFDEWITLNNPIKEIVISPPTIKPLRYSTKGKRVIFEFAEDEVLKENVTYQINFGKAVKDYSVGNIFENYVFVFSTGPVIDSLELSGTVIDELNKKPVKDVLVMLYDNLSDSVLYNQKPFYFSRTKEDGTFKLQNLRSDSFQIFALKDENVSYTYDLPSEIVGFYDHIIHTSDTINSAIQINVFDERDPLRYISREHLTRGLIKVVYNRQPKELEYEFLEKDSVEYIDEFVGDSLFIWYTNMNLDSSQLVINHQDGRDSIFIKKAKKTFSSGDYKVASPLNPNIKVFENDSILILFERPLLSIDSSQFLLKDSTDIIPIDTIFIDKRNLQIYANLTAGNEYELSLLPDAVNDWFSNTNKDTINFKVQCKSSEELGIIEFNVLGVDSVNYIFQLIKDAKELDTKYINSNQTITLNRMVSGKYSLKIIEDLNGDGEWTPGRLISKLASERIKEITLDELKKGWELKLDVDLKEIFNGIKIE